MKIINKNSSSVCSRDVKGKNIIGTISTYYTLKPMKKEKTISDIKQRYKSNELKVESDAYDLIRKSLS
jgi:hypothetical protein